MDEKRPLNRLGNRTVDATEGAPLHPSWRAFIEYCSKLEHGEIERLSIQNGLPVIAERTKQKVKFTS
jgi:hypothetical protein